MGNLVGCGRVQRRMQRHLSTVSAIIGLTVGCGQAPDLPVQPASQPEVQHDKPLILSPSALQEAFLIGQDQAMRWRFSADRCVIESWGVPLPETFQNATLTQSGPVYRVAGNWQLMDDGHRLRLNGLQADGPQPRDQADLPVAVGPDHTLLVAGQTYVLQNYLEHREVLPYESFVGRLVAVESGHVVQVEHGGQRETMRLAGLICPDPQTEVGQQAMRRTDELMRGRRLQIKVYDQPAEQPRRAQIFTSSFYWVNLQLIQEGLAWHDKPSDGEWLFSTREDVAREAGLGIWAHPELKPPWWPKRLDAP